jgi:Na+/melibiose symporter-like transporter
MTLVQSAIPFVATEICLLTPADTVYFYVPAVLAALLCYPLVTWLSDRIGKRRVFSGSLLASAIVLAGLMLIGDWLPVPLKVQGIVWAVLQAMAVSGATVLASALAAEITDHDAILTGQRREVAYYSTLGLLDHVVTGTASALLPVLLLFGRSRSDLHGPLGVRLIGVAGGLMMLAAFVIFLRYPLGHPRV